MGFTLLLPGSTGGEINFVLPNGAYIVLTADCSIK